MIYILVALAILVISFTVALISLAKETGQQKKEEEIDKANASISTDNTAVAKAVAAGERAAEGEVQSGSRDEAREALRTRVEELKRAGDPEQKVEEPIDVLSDTEPFPWEKKTPGNPFDADNQEVITHGLAQGQEEKSLNMNPQSVHGEQHGNQDEPFFWEEPSGDSSKVQSDKPEPDKFSGVIDFRKKEEP